MRVVLGALKYALIAQGVEARRGALGCFLPAPAAGRSAGAERWHAAQPECHDNTGCVSALLFSHSCFHLDKFCIPMPLPAAAWLYSLQHWIALGVIERMVSFQGKPLESTY